MNLFQLKNETQTYAWGKLGISSKVAQLLSSSGSVPCLEDTPYAELWMGTHVNGPSKLVFKEKEILLKEFLTEHPHLLSTKEIAGKQTGDLVYLLKVLSIEKPLSIQVHPNKHKAKELFRKFPEIYKDDNHKPELALALTPFSALVGFQKHCDIKANILNTPELKQLLEEENNIFLSPQQNLDIKNLFTTLMFSKEHNIIQNTQKLIQRLEQKENLTKSEKTALYLNKYFPSDIGIFCSFFLNKVELKQGQAIFLKANVPHAYISGDIIEVMARSDNVIRCGLTPKFRDVQTLCDIVDVSPFDKKNILEGVGSSGIKKYGSDVCKDFEVEKIEVEVCQSLELGVCDYGCIILVYSGLVEFDTEGVMGESGYSWFQAAGSSCKILNRGEEKAILFRAKKGESDVKEELSYIVKSMEYEARSIRKLF
eukprot:snap_masked-scaffold_21-processed-gene-2.15-mRNA-1 protein AED:0.16 eAED:0.20 QI:0/0/0/1/1/1/3/0/424